MCICVMFCRNPMLLFFPSQPGRILQARQNFASPNFCLGSRERFGAEQNQIPEFPHVYSPGDGGAVELRKIPNIGQFRGITYSIKNSVFFSKFYDFFTLVPPSLFKSRPAGTAPLNGRTVKSNVDESFSLDFPLLLVPYCCCCRRRQTFLSPCL
jgi:hypothetical protein